MENQHRAFIAYEYKEIPVDGKNASFYMDCYEAFGWQADEYAESVTPSGRRLLKLKRERKIINKAELTRLQRHFESCVNEIEMLEKSKKSTANMWSLLIGLIGTAFMAGSVFAVTNTPPQILLCIILAIPAFIGWILPIFVYRNVLRRQTEKVQPLIEKKYDEIYDICEKGSSLL